ncbi:ribosomal protein S18-alanine N-acetyltransferase [Hydrocarboniclastica marina]|uniref:ribosomal protein S18-alanine N-acetyltransferase n=1 Tax=Hydrocarboniclastica marina TaxID=2259620 RepID=UPI0026B90949
MRAPYVTIPEEQCHFGELSLHDLGSILSIERSGHAFPWTETVFKDCFKPGYDCWGLWSGGELHGFAILARQYDELHLLNLCIHRSFQGAGLGRRLLRYAVAQAQAASARCMLLEVRASNRAAIALYVNEGFATIGYRKDYYPAGNGREDAQVMSLNLHHSP